jgi:hypothetical protein
MTETRWIVVAGFCSFVLAHPVPHPPDVPRGFAGVDAPPARLATAVGSIAATPVGLGEIWTVTHGAA